MSRPPVLGYNHNVKYKGVLYHVQTEDSGDPGNHVTTQVFHEGAIIASKRYDYTSDLESEDAEQHQDIIKKYMREQHKGMIKELLRGSLDEKIRTMLGFDVGDGDPAQSVSSEASSSREDPAGRDASDSSGDSYEPKAPDVEKVSRAHYLDVDRAMQKEGERAVDSVVAKIEHQLASKDEEDDEDRVPSSISSAFSLMNEEAVWNDEGGTFDSSDIEKGVRALARMDSSVPSKDSPGTRHNIDLIIIQYLRNVDAS